MSQNVFHIHLHKVIQVLYVIVTGSYWLKNTSNASLPKLVLVLITREIGFAVFHQ